MLGKVIRHNGNQLLIEFEDEINSEYLTLLARESDNLALVKLMDQEPKTVKQNALAHALIGDIAIWYGDYPKVVEEKVLKPLFKSNELYEFGHTEAGKADISKWIEFLIEFVLAHGVPLPKRYKYLTEQTKFFYFSCKYRTCCVCGVPHAQIHHVHAVGNRKRNAVDHREFPMASLCWKHHNIAHKIGQIEFLEKFKVIPVYLDKDVLIKIGIMSNAQIMRFDEKYKTAEAFAKAVEE